MTPVIFFEIFFVKIHLFFGRQFFRRFTGACLRDGGFLQ